MRQQTNMPSSVISGHSMHLGVLATTWHAIQTGTIFTVYYKPGTSSAEFIVPYNQYMESTKTNYSIGMIFKMGFEGEEVLEERKLQADWVCNVAWAKGDQALLYVVTHQNKKPYSKLGSKDEDVMLLEEPCENVHANIRHTKDFNFVTVNISSTTYSKVCLINAADPLAGLTLVWECECEACAHCIIEHHQGYFYLFTNADKGRVSVDYHYLLRSPPHSAGPRKLRGSVRRVHIALLSIIGAIFIFSPMLIKARSWLLSLSTSQPSALCWS